MKKLFLILPAIIFLADRIVKYFAPSISVEGGFIKLGFYKNYAGAFSLPIGGWLYNIAGIILLIIFFYFLIKEIKTSITSSLLVLQGGGWVGDFRIFSFALVFLGGLSNIFDRLTYGYTIDYVNFMNVSFFNIADAMLLAGIFILLFFQLRKRYEK